MWPRSPLFRLRRADFSRFGFGRENRSPCRRLGLALCGFAAALALAAQQSAYGEPASPMSEYEAKARILEQFTKFVEWPEPQGPADSPFALCILGNDPFGPYLKRATDDRKMGSHPIVVRPLANPDDALQCQLIFVARSERAALARLAAKTDGKPVLTVGDGAGFAEQGLLLNFYLASEHVRFEANPRAIQRSGLKVSARLLKLARLVGPGA